MLIKLPVSHKKTASVLDISSVSHVLLQKKINILETYRSSLLYLATSTITDNLLKT